MLKIIEEFILKCFMAIEKFPPKFVKMLQINIQQLTK